MLLLNMVFLGFLTLGSILYTYRNRSELACMDGMMMAMAIGSLSGICLGLNLQPYLPGNLALSTILAVLIGMAAGFATGRIVSLTASIDGVMAGIMGGMMSPMLGAMLAQPMPLIWFMDLVYVFVLILLVFLVKEARQAFLEENSLNTSSQPVRDPRLSDTTDDE